MKLPFFLKSLSQRLNKSENIKKMTPKEKWMFFLLLGLLLAVIFFPAEKKESSSLKNIVENKGQKEELSEVALGVSGMNLNQYELYLSKQLEAILSEMDGAGKVQAWVTVASGNEKVLVQESDIEETHLQEADSVGGTRQEETKQVNESVITDDKGAPYVIKTLQPEVEGVFVVAEGAGNSVIKKNISEAIEVLFGIDAHRIKVAKKKVEE